MVQQSSTVLTKIKKKCTIAFVCAYAPVGHLAGTHTAAASGAVGLSGAAKCSPGAVGGAELHEPHPGCSEPIEITQTSITL